MTSKPTLQDRVDEIWAHQKDLYTRFVIDLHGGNPDYDKPNRSNHALATALTDIIMDVEVLLRTRACVTERDIAQHTAGYWSKGTRDRALHTAVRWGMLEITEWRGKTAWKHSSKAREEQDVKSVLEGDQKV